MKRIKSTTLPLTAIIGLLIIAINLFGALLAPWIAPHTETDQVGDIWMLPSLQMPLGTDNLGRDMLSRILFGARTTIAIALTITFSSFVIGIITGFTAAIYGKWVDVLLTRIVDTLMSIPVLILALIVLSVMGTSIPVLVMTIALLDATRVFRLARLVAQGIVCLEYVEAARLRGEGMFWLLRREILPNAIPLCWQSLACVFALPSCLSPASASSASVFNRLTPIGAAWCVTMPRRLTSAKWRRCIPRWRLPY